MKISIKFWLVLVIPIVLASGCKKSEPAAAVSAPTPAVAATDGSVITPGPGAPPAAAPALPPGETLNLDREVRRWILRNRRPPKNFADFAATAGVDIPPPPAGKKYVLDKTMHVIVEKL